MLILADPLQAFFETLTPASEDLPFLVPSSAIYNALISIVAAFGLGYIAVGLSIARRYTDTRSRWATGWFVPVATVFGALVGVLAVSRIEFGGTPMTPPLAIYLASSVILGVVRLAVWACLSSVVTRGWLGRGAACGLGTGVGRDMARPAHPRHREPDRHHQVGDDLRDVARLRHRLRYTGNVCFSARSSSAFKIEVDETPRRRRRGRGRGRGVLEDDVFEDEIRRRRLPDEGDDFEVDFVDPEPAAK